MTVLPALRLLSAILQPLLRALWQLVVHRLQLLTELLLLLLHICVLQADALRHINLLLAVLREVVLQSANVQLYVAQ